MPKDSRYAVTGRWRVGRIWIVGCILGGLTAANLLSVRIPAWGYTPVQSLQVFRNPALSGVLYFVWFSVLLMLLWQARRPWHGSLLVAMFALTQIGVFVFATPLGAGEDWLDAVGSPLIQKSGRISRELYGYSNFPSLALLGALASTTAGVGVMDLRTPILVSWLVLISQILFAGYRRVLGSVRLAALAGVIVFESNLILSRFYFHPAVMGVTLTSGLVGFLLACKNPLNRRGMCLVLAFIASLAMTHLVSSLVALIVLVGFLVMRRRHPEVPAVPMMIAAALLNTAWSLYWAGGAFKDLVGFLPRIDDRFSQGIAFLWVGRVARANTEGMPPWVMATQVFWWLVIYLAGGLIALRTLARRLSSSDPANCLAAAYALLASANVVAVAVSPGGYDFYRVIVYGSPLAAPLVVGHLLSGRKRWLAAAIFSLVLLFLGFPSLVAHNTTVGIAATRPEEIAAAQFLSSAISEDEGISVFGGFRGPDIVSYYRLDVLPNVRYIGSTSAETTEKQVGNLWRHGLAVFSGTGGRGESFFFLTARELMWYRHLFRVPEFGPLWRGVRDELEKSHRIFDAGPVQLYQS
jgi:hypothetical protein